jgi:hypothetical protein
MHHRIIITARNSRDESCDLYRLTWHFDVDVNEFTPKALKGLINEVKDEYLASWPQGKSVRAPSKAMIPIDVKVLSALDLDEPIMESVPSESKAA